MTIIKRNGRYYAKLKSGRNFVAGRTFDTQREAKARLARERAALDGSVDPRAGRERMREAVGRWLEIRRTTVAVKTHRSDKDVARLTPTSMLALQLSAISEREVSRVFEHLPGFRPGRVVSGALPGEPVRLLRVVRPGEVDRPEPRYRCQGAKGLRGALRDAALH